MADTPSIGVLAKLGTADSGGVTATQPFVFISETLSKHQSIVERDGIRGTRSHTALDTRLGNAPVDGTLVMEPTPEDLAIWFPRILGAAAAGTSYLLAETVPDFALWVDRIAKVFGYAKNWVDRATFSASEGQPMRMSLELVGTDEAVANAGTFPALTITYTQPYLFTDMVLTLGGTARQAKEFTLTIDNHLIKDRFFNSTIRQLAPSEDRTVTLSCTVPYSVENTALYAQALAGAAGTLVLTNAGYSTTFSFGVLQVPYDTPTVTGKGEVMLTLNMVARKTGSTLELAVTHDSTP